jgi:hypothetical protein
VDKVFKGLRPIKPEEKSKTGSKEIPPGKKFCSVCHITPDNSTLFLENGANISQPGTPLLMPLENITTGNLTDTNITG